MKPSTEETTKRDTFACDGCGKRIELSVYALAQMTMGHALTFTHRKEDGGCGERTEVLP